MQTCAVAIMRVCGHGATKRGDRISGLTQRCPRFAEREPRRGKIRREFHGLRQQVRRRFHVATRRKIACERIAAIGREVAG